MKEQVLVVGCGGIGGVIAASLVRAGYLVTGLTGNPEITHAIRTRGLCARIASGEQLRVDMPVATHAEELSQQFSLVLLSVPPNAAVKAAQSVLPHLTPDAPVVCFQNGLIEEQLASVMDPSRVVGGIVAFGASMQRPGEVEQTSAGGFVVGTLSSSEDGRAAHICSVLGHVGTAEVTSNLRGARWSKLAINCAISSLGTLGGERLGVLMRHRFVRRLCLEVMTEVTQVAVASGIHLEKVAGTLDLEWLALDDEERCMSGSPGLLAKHTVLLAVGAKYRRLRSSMLSAIERGRKPPVEYLNGEVTRRGDQLGIPVPINQALLHAVQAAGEGKLQPSLTELRRLFDESRGSLRALHLAV